VKRAAQAWAAITPEGVVPDVRTMAPEPLPRSAGYPAASVYVGGHPLRLSLPLARLSAPIRPRPLLAVAIV